MATVTAPIAAADDLPTTAIVTYPNSGYTTGAADHLDITYAFLKEVRDQWASLDAGGAGGSGWATTAVAAGTGNATTDTTNIQNALNAGGLVVLAADSTYLVNTLAVAVDNTTLDCNGSTLEQNATGTHDGILKAEGTDTTTATNKRYFTLRNGVFFGMTTPTFSQYSHLLVLSGVSDVLVENMIFTGFRGDGAYVGSGHVSAVERHNERVTFRKCFFDGVNKTNRNGLSIIDCATFRMDDCWFTRTSRSDMPGAFDIEPNSTYNIVQDVKVTNCTAYDCGGGVGDWAVALIANTQAAMTVPIQDIHFTNITSRASTAPSQFFAQQSGTPTTDTAPNNITVNGLFIYSGTKPVDLSGGTKGVKIRNLQVYNATGSIQVGYATPCLDTAIEDFYLHKSASSATYIAELFKSTRLTFRNGTIEGNNGYVFQLGLGSGSVGNSTDFEISGVTYRNATSFTASKMLNKHASHTFSGTWKYYNNDDLGLAVDATATTGIAVGRTGGGWEVIGATQVAAAAVTTGAITIPIRDLLRIEIRIPSLSTGDIVALRFNGDTGNTYNSRYITAAVGGTTLTNVQTLTTSMARLSGISSAASRRIVVALSNAATPTKVGTVQPATGSGAVGTAPVVEIGGQIEWFGSAQITSVTLLTVGASATLAAGTSMVVFGRNTMTNTA